MQINIDVSIKITTKLTSPKKTATYVDLLLDLEVIKKNADPKATSDFVDGYDIEVLEDELAIRNSIVNLFTVRKGEVYLNPEYGLPLYKYIAEPLTVSTAELIGNELYTAIKKWEPRVEVKDIYVLPNEELYMYQILINITIPRFNKQLSFGGGFAINDDMAFVLA